MTSRDDSNMTASTWQVNPNGSKKTSPYAASAHPDEIMMMMATSFWFGSAGEKEEGQGQQTRLSPEEDARPGYEPWSLNANEMSRMATGVNALRNKSRMPTSAMARGGCEGASGTYLEHLDEGHAQREVGHVGQDEGSREERSDRKNRADVHVPLQQTQIRPEGRTDQLLDRARAGSTLGHDSR